MDRLRGISASVGLAAIAVAGLAGVALAQSDICTRLEARLMALDSNPGSGSEVGKYREADRAVRRQRREFDQASEEAERAGCLGGLFGQFRRGGNCGRVVANLNRAQANLDRLTRARDRYSADPFDDGRERAELLGALAQNGCGEQYEAGNRPARRPGLFATLFGGRLFRERGWGDSYGSDFGTFRTLCVRTCDGYYFPINFSTTRSRFAADEEICKAQCPGTEVSLYIHHSPGEESDAMVSLAGEPYTALPAAFRYRREYDKSCTCGKIARLNPALTEMPVEAVSQGRDPWGFARTAEGPDPLDGHPPVPTARPTADDPETLANRAGSFAPKSAPVPAAVAELKPAGERSVRIVGPSYFYAQ